MTGGAGGVSSSSGGSGGSTSIGATGNSTAGDQGFGGACAGEITKGELIPLDVYIMLDTSRSMVDFSGVAITKWQAVKTALTTFLQDPTSTGIGVGIQYFPLVQSGVPSSCMNDAECGAAGPCVLKICYGYASQGLILCTKNGDCGPYTPCLTRSYCANDSYYWPCNPGASCGMDDYGN
ncbi:MAG TPA: hypothetical protein VGP93_05545, partial [Polyangiaceae bacterium]|nr:hypothetical protein [Polyangiaceae bacterium]